MAMVTTCIRFKPEEQEMISAFADLNGLSFSAQVRKWALECMEDELDAHDAQEALEQARREGDEGVPFSVLKDR